MLDLAHLKLPPIRHIGIVVESLPRAMAYYTEGFRLGPWFKPPFGPSEHLFQGQAINTSYTTATAFSGGVEYQLIQVLGGDRDSCLAHLEQYGEGVHHLGAYVTDLPRRLAAYQQVGIGVLQQGSVQGAASRWSPVTHYAYLDSAGVGGVVIELLQLEWAGIPLRPSRPLFELASRLGMLEKVAL